MPFSPRLSSEATLPKLGGVKEAVDMPVIVLAGGKGTRLYPYTVTFPKPLVPIGDKPIIEIMLRQLARAGAKDITVSLGHLAELMVAFLGDGHKFGLDISYVREEKPLGTVGPLRLVPDIPENFLLLNGDVFTDLAYGELFRGHVQSGAAVSIACFKKKVKVELGVLVSDAQRVSDYIEKPTYEFDVSMGAYVVNRSVLEYIPEDQYFDFPMLIKTLLAHGEHVRCVPFDGIWLDIGCPADYEAAQRTFLQLPGHFLQQESS